MVNQKDDHQSLWMMGAAMMLPLILVSGPLAGYALGRFVGVGYFGLPKWTLPISVGLGFVASAIQIVRLIKGICESESKL